VNIETSPSETLESAGTLPKPGGGAIAADFPDSLEQRFRHEYLEQNLLRARVSTLIYLALLVVLSAINFSGGLVPTDSLLGPIFAIRALVLCPALAIILAATYFQPLKKRYQLVVGLSATLAGVAVMAITSLSATAALPQFSQMGNVLVVVYACLFLGLLSRAVIGIAAILVAAYFIMGLAVGLPTGNLAFGGALLTATALMAVLSALRVESLVRSGFMENRMLNDAAQRDGLTGLLNRRAFDTLAERLWRRAQRDKDPLQLLLIDIDCFKEYNDRYGHQAGDACIQEVARVIEGSARRPFDFCARYGGEEFALFIYGQPAEHAEDLPQQIQAAIIGRRMPHERSSVAEVVTVSIGSAFLELAANQTLVALIQAADEALYSAKHAGRNRIVHKNAASTAQSTGVFQVITGKFKAVLAGHDPGTRDDDSASAQG
jgi:diguanylate cyclase (GGDEF)-like protein